jgi:eukaryotic-like serine/threonine-protein kinase
MAESAFQEVLREGHEKLLKLRISRMLRNALFADLDVLYSACLPRFPLVFFGCSRLSREVVRMLLEGQHLGRYRLVRLLGSGGMGEVYLAEDARIGQQVAIKVIRAEGIAYPQSESAKEAARLFEREARAIARLDHPNILPLYAYGEETLHETPLTYLVMPYRKEGTLASWLRLRGSATPLSPAEVAPLLHQAAAALQHAHDQHVLHQDIKPTNFLIRERSDQPERPDLLLSDFGIAKLTSATGSLSQSIRGTPVYMAPEQWDGHPVAASDQYALAIMVYELLVGRPPFVGNPGQIMRQHYLVPPPAPSSLGGHLSPAIDAVLLHAIAKQPEERFASVTAFARAFQEAMQSEGALHATLTISRAEAESGTTRTLTVPGGRQVSVTVPAGVGNGSILRLEGQGMSYYTGGPAGPLVLTLAVPAEASPLRLAQDFSSPTVANTLREPDKSDTYATLAISEAEALAGTHRLLTLPGGRHAPVTIPAGTQDGQMFRFEGLGEAASDQDEPSALILTITIAPSGEPAYLTNADDEATVISSGAFASPNGAVEPAPQELLQEQTQESVSVLDATDAEELAPPFRAIGSPSTTSRHRGLTAILLVGLAVLVAVGSSVGFFLFTRNNQPSPFPAYRTLALDDPLSDNSHGYRWDENNTDKYGTCAFTQGAYHVDATLEGGTKNCASSSSNYSDFAYEVQMTIVKGDEGGILFRLDGNGNSYLFSIDQNGSYLLWFYFNCPNSCNLSGLRSGSSPFINTGLNKPNLVAVVAKGSTIDLYVNNHKIDDVSDSTYSQGQFGVFATDVNGPPSEVVFRDAKVWTP